jgi:hypothetical protein
MADETRKILLELTLDAVNAVKNQKELNDLLKKTKAELKEAAIGSEEYKKLETSQGLVEKRLKGLNQVTKQSTAELNVQKGSVRDLQAQYNALTSALRETTPGNQVLGQSFEEAREKALKLKTEIREFNKSLGDDTGNVGNYGSAFKEAAGGINVFGTSLDGLFKIITTNPIGIIITALFALFNILKQNDEIATFFKGVMTGLGIVMDNVAGFISNLVLKLTEFNASSGTTAKFIKDVLVRAFNAVNAPLTYLIELIPALSAALEGEFEKAAGIAEEATLNFGKSVLYLNDEMPEFIQNLSEAVAEGVEYEKALDAIEARQSKLNVSNKQLENQRDRLLLQSKDLSKSEEERIALTEKAANIDKKIFQQKLSLLDEEIVAQEKYVNALDSGSTKREEAEFRLNDLQVKRLEFEGESLKFQEKIINKQNALIEKQEAEEQKAFEAEKKRREERIKHNEEISKRDTDAIFKIEQLKRDQLAKTAKNLDEKLKAELKAEDFRVQVLLRNENLLASEKEFILADSAARIEKINADHNAKIQEQDKKTVEEYKKKQLEKVNFVQTTANQVNDIASNLNTARLNNEESALEDQRQRELKKAGNNAKKQQKINEEYDKRKAAIEKQAAERQRDLQAGMALVNTFTGVTKVIAEYPKFDFGIMTAIGVGLTLAQGLAQYAAIKSQKFGLGGLFGGMKKFAMGGLQKAGIIGGLPHSAGGTKFVGSDGSMFEAEAGELLAIVNKRDTPLISQLSAINSIHGKPFYKDGGTYLADGGFAARSNSQVVVDQAMTRSQINDIMSNQPPVIVTVEDINAGVSNRSKVISRANI